MYLPGDFLCVFNCVCRFSSYWLRVLTQMSLRSQKSVDFYMSFPSLKEGPFSGTYKEAWTNLRPSGSWLLAETVLVNSYSRVMGYFNGKNLGSLWFPAICYKSCQLSRHGDYLGLLIWLGFMLLGQIIRFLFRKWLSDSQNPSVNQKYS